MNTQECPPEVDLEIWEALPPDLKVEILKENKRERLDEVSNYSKKQQTSLFSFGVRPEVDLTKERSKSKEDGEKKATFPRRTKQPKLMNRPEGLRIQGCDFGASEESSFTDLDFRPIPASIDGIRLEYADGRIGKDKNKDASVVKYCFCNIPVKFQRVQKPGPNQGRLFKCCSKPYHLGRERCTFFAWANEADEEFVHKDAVTELSWVRFESSSGFRMTPSNGLFQPEAILQGRVGDCWFLSAVAIVSMREDLCSKIVLNYPSIPSDGKLTFRLFINGIPEHIVIDNYLPVKTTESVSVNQKRRRKSSRGVDSLEFSNCGENSCMWVPFLEKAYAKAHGSYHAISGGWIHEALFDLTGAPCLEIDFSSSNFDSEMMWAKLASYHSARFPLGCSTSFSSNGIVGCHAYSILEVQELQLEDYAGSLGMQASIKAFTTSAGDSISGSKKGTSTSLLEQEAQFSVHLTAHGSLRLLRIRNPWGRKSFTGAFSHSSEFWTPSMRRRLTQGKNDDGTFWMSFHDFLAHFTSVDVCLASASSDYIGISMRDTTVPVSLPVVGKNMHVSGYNTANVIELTVPPDAGGTIYVTVVQNSLRGTGHKTKVANNHTSINHFAVMIILLLMREEKGPSVQLTYTSAPQRTSEPLEVALEGGSSYRLQVLHLGLDSQPSPFVVRLYGPRPLIECAVSTEIQPCSSLLPPQNRKTETVTVLEKCEQCVVESLATCYTIGIIDRFRSLSRDIPALDSSSPLYERHSLYVEQGTLWKEAYQGKYYHLAHLSSNSRDSRMVSFLVLFCESIPSNVASLGTSSGVSSSTNSVSEAVRVRVVLRTANRLVLSPFLVPGSATHVTSTIDKDVSVSLGANLGQEARKELYTERLLSVPLEPQTVRVVAVVVRALGGSMEGAIGGNSHKTQMGHKTPDGRVLPVAATARLVRNEGMSSSSSSSSLSSSSYSSSNETKVPAFFAACPTDVSVKDFEKETSHEENRTGGSGRIVIDLASCL